MNKRAEQQERKKIKYDLIYLLVSIYLFVCVFLLYIFVGTCWSEGKLREKTQLKSSESVQVIQIERQTQRELLNEIMYVPLLLMLLKRKKMDRLDNIFSASLDQSILEYMAAAVFFLSLILFI